MKKAGAGETGIAVNKPLIHALIPAAGKGLRFGGSTLKQYLGVAGKTVLEHSIEAVNLYPEISGITVVLAPDDRMFPGLINTKALGVNTVTGGDSRADSVLNGLKYIREHQPETEWVLVHDAARPCLPRECLRRLLQEGVESTDGAILAVPVRDTLKESDDSGRIGRTVERSGLWAAQTPQLFPLADLIHALESMLEDGLAPTDEAAAMERSGKRPLLVMGSTANIKITWPDDVAIAETWLTARMVDE